MIVMNLQVIHVLGGDARNHIAIRRDRGDDDDDDIAADEELELPVNVRLEVSIGDEGPELKQTEQILEEAEVDVTTQTSQAEKIRAEEAERSYEADVERQSSTVPEQSLPKPVPTQRKSTRVRRPPNRFDDYVMHQVVPCPVDSKMEAATSLMGSGILNTMDAETVHRILAAIFNK